MNGKRILRRGAILLAITLLASCVGISKETAAILSLPAAHFPEVRFAVFSDPHLFDRRLGTEGKAFTEYLADDRKMLVESEELLQEAVRKVKDMHVQFLLVPGDLTKDGERQDHELFVRYLAELKESGIPAYVIPGNHDVLNPRASRYTAAGEESVPDVTPAEFAGLYADFGYAGALLRDPDSLSYVAEPVPGLWLLALDACEYRQNAGRSRPVAAGRLTPQTLRWTEGVLARAAREGVPVIAMMHHGVVEHFKGEEQFFGDYLVESWREVSALLAAYHVRVVFTGHYHAQDVTERKWDDGRFLFDVETGSLVTDPSPVREATINASQQMTIRSSFITQLPSFTARGMDFRRYSRERLREALSGFTFRLLRKYLVPADEAALLSGQIAEAFAAHFEGDERFTGKEKLKRKGLSFMGSIIMASRGDFIEGLWDDLPPADNDVSIDLTTGAYADLSKGAYADLSASAASQPRMAFFLSGPSP